MYSMKPSLLTSLTYPPSTMWIDSQRLRLFESPQSHKPLGQFGFRRILLWETLTLPLWIKQFTRLLDAAKPRAIVKECSQVLITSPSRSLHDFPLSTVEVV